MGISPNRRLNVKKPIFDPEVRFKQCWGAPGSERRKQIIAQRCKRKSYHKHLGKCCRLCGGTKRLCVHHKDGNHHNNKRKNLLTLCSHCHTFWHTARSGNTRFYKKWFNITAYLDGYKKPLPGTRAMPSNDLGRVRIKKSRKSPWRASCEAVYTVALLDAYIA